MSFTNITAGQNPPDEINAVIEIPANSSPVKYEMDKKIGVLNVDRFLSTAMFYPCNYGYIPQTLSEDGDPLDVLVITPIPLIHWSVIRCRPVGMLNMTDEAGIDAKLLAVPIDKLTPAYRHIKTIEDVPREELAKIAHFFENYKALEAGKWVKVENWQGIKEAKNEIMQSIERYKTHSGE